MLAIARGLVARPKIMLVDEPTEGLAPLLVQSLTDILREINRRGTTILLVEQTLEVAMALSHRLYVMDQGRIQFEGTPGRAPQGPHDPAALPAALTLSPQGRGQGEGWSTRPTRFPSRPVYRLEMTRREWALLAVLAILWGVSFFFSKVALAELPPFTLVLGRFGIAALALLLAARLGGHRIPRSPRVWAGFFVLGALNSFIPFGLIAWGQVQLTSGLASILNATTPLFTALVAHAWGDERLDGQSSRRRPGGPGGRLRA